MLGQHSDSVVFGNAVVQVVPETCEEVVEYRADAIARYVKQGPDACLVALGDVAD